VSAVAAPETDGTKSRYILLNLAAPEVRSETMREIKQLSESWSPGQPRLGVGAIISYFRQSPKKASEQLRRLLALCEEHKLAVIVQLDGEQWWTARPDLWNWWDKARTGYDPANAANVEWSGWGPEHALKIAWRNWGQQWRVQPPPNLMSPRYRDACHAAMEPLVKEVVRWRDNLPADKRWLLVGVKVGWESAIGMGSHYYPDGNALLDKDPADDPDRRAKPELLPGRGYQPIGYAAVSMAGLAHDGELKEGHLAEIVRRHLDDLSAVARQAGLPREQIFTHCGGWAEGERLYRSAVNENSCPGWSFYRYGRDPLGDKTAMTAAAASNAPYWAATEWLPIGARTADDWKSALRNTLATDRCRYVCIYNWRKVKTDAVAREGIRGALDVPLPAGTRPILQATQTNVAH
jgi:hypothetical protein